jgi:hypothetical protein
MYVWTGEGLGRLQMLDGQVFRALGTHEGLGQLGQSAIGQAIGVAKRQMIHYDLQGKYAAGAGKTDDGTAAASSSESKKTEPCHPMTPR